jgi:DNA-binding CsgD family transcriptional regulator
VTERRKALRLGPTPTEKELRARTRQQSAVAELGNLALSGVGEEPLFDAAAVRVAETLEVEASGVLELLPGGAALLLRAGSGWRQGLVGRATLGSGLESHAGYALERNEPVIIADLRSEKRFRPPALLRDHGMTSGVSVLIRGDGVPFGVLGAYTKARRNFTRDDVQFLQVVANILALSHRRRRQEIARQQRAVLLGRLSRREREVLKLLAAGAANREIGERLGVKYTTVRSYVRAVIEKLDAHSALEAVAHAHAYGLVEDEPPFEAPTVFLSDRQDAERSHARPTRTAVRPPSHDSPLTSAKQG